MERRETLAELIARTVVEFERREIELQEAQMHQIKPQKNSSKQRKSKKAA